ncbi:MAG TPA: methyltransferase domain-containing protein [Candidatus Acidoferrales bacterium]|nr:methyltransferase domain-containing protein [Candidatus Acidoferrales bacterium]
MHETRYVHGYSSRESLRLADQANALADLLHHDTVFAQGSLVLECGCGTGAQTVHLAARNPQAHLISVDISPESLEQARQRVVSAGHRNVEFRLADIFHLPFDDGQFDHVFVCFVLENLSDPVAALRAVTRLLRKGGLLTAIEGDHGSWYCHPPSPSASLAVQCLIDLQARLGGDSLVGRRLYPLVREAGLRDVHVSPRMVYVDSSRPDLVESFTRNTFIAMVEGVRDQALSLGLIDQPAWDRGIADLYRATESDGTFCYTFFKATATL